MNFKLYQKDDLKFFSLKILLEIKNNQYRSKNNDQDFCPFSVEDKIYELGHKKAQKLKEKPNIGPIADPQLGALMSINQPKKYLLFLIDLCFYDHRFNRRIGQNRDAVFQVNEKPVINRTHRYAWNFFRRKTCFASDRSRNHYRTVQKSHIYLYALFKNIKSFFKVFRARFDFFNFCDLS